jgi:GTP-sensing pleiotropic transcriptional regulator CodY
LIEAFKRKHLGGQIVLSAKVTGGMPRSTKMRAATELAEFGLIEIRSMGKKATVVSIIRL